VIECCLSSDPASRFCDALELIRALDDESMAWDAEDRAARDEAWQDIESAMALGDFATAAGACNAFLQTWPNDQEARCLSEKLQTRYADAEQVYRQIEDGLGSGALGRMADLLQQAVNLYPDHPSGVRVQVQIASLAREFQECMKSGLRLLRCGAWEGALQCFQRAHALDHGSPAVLQALDFVTEVVQRVRSTRVEIDDAIRRRDKTMALAQARALDAYVDEVRAFLLELDG
jgi:tetratricopeptide (TPR) repeat protein